MVVGGRLLHPTDPYGFQMEKGGGRFLFAATTTPEEDGAEDPCPDTGCFVHFPALWRPPVHRGGEPAVSQISLTAPLLIEPPVVQFPRPAMPCCRYAPHRSGSGRRGGPIL